MICRVKIRSGNLAVTVHNADIVVDLNCCLWGFKVNSCISIPRGGMSKRALLLSSLLMLDLKGQPAYAGLIPNDPYFGKQWALYNDGSFHHPSNPAVKAGADMDMPDAWEIETGDSSIIVAIIDTGCKWKHKEFEGRIWINHKEIPGNGIDDDGNGYIDDVNGWNFQAKNNDITDNLGHGTGMASIIGANGNNGVGYAGMDWKCKLMICKVTDTSEAVLEVNTIAAVHYAVDNGARIINISLSGRSATNALKSALDYAQSKNVLVVAGSGNFGIDTVGYPAAYDNCLAVGATNPDDTRSATFFWGGGSNYGPQLDVVAPGNYIYELDYLTASEYGYLTGGTSNSTAFVSGLASLLLAQNPSRTPADLRAIIESTADDGVGNPSEDVKGWDPYYGHGRINAFKALSYLNNSIRSTQKRLAGNGKAWIVNPVIWPRHGNDFGFTSGTRAWDLNGKKLNLRPLLSTNEVSNGESVKVINIGSPFVTSE